MKKFLLIICAALLIAGCGDDVKQINSIDDLKTARIGAWPKCAYELKAREVLPEAQFVGLDFISDLVQNLKQRKIDAFVLGKTYVENLKFEGVDVDYLPQSLGDVPISYVFTKNERGQKLCNQMNEFLAKAEASGELDALRNKWLHSDESKRTFTKSNLSGENGTLKVTTEAKGTPFEYLRDGQVVGFEVELLDKFCAAYGYDYEIKVDIFETMLIEVTTGRIDIGMDAIEILPEREKSMLFANPTDIEQTVAVINPGTSGKENFFAALEHRIKTSLFDENRWRMILEGAGRTLAITLTSTIFGTLLALAMYMLYREGNRRVNKIIDEIYRTLQGVPTMVLLLIFYYVVFANFDLPAIIVAIVVFSIVLSITVFIMLKSGAESISRGQTEAALSLGYSGRRAFVKFILPQVVRNNFKQYQLALNVTLLETAVVGYISVQDLTRVADLIRARTYDAFVPLIAIAIVYLLLSRLLLFVTDCIARRLDPKNRSREKILDGVKL